MKKLSILPGKQIQKWIMMRFTNTMKKFTRGSHNDEVHYHNRELLIDDIIEMHEQEQVIEELESLDLVQSENRMMVGNLTEGLRV
ncbi:hypothetical protein TNCV_2925861 [Trichonephila clavipes]|nr:hypothetical protein TNCV_2925861 [Trichonephila clavipes]